MDAQLRLVNVPFAPTKVCGWCRRWKARSEFSRAINQPDGLQGICKECHARNVRLNHNVRDEPPVPRWSAYDVVSEHLEEIAAALRAEDLEGARLAVDRFRERLRLNIEL